MRELNILTKTGEQLTEQRLHRAFAFSGDRYFHDAIEDFEVLAGEYPEDGVSGMIRVTTEKDPEAMKTECVWYFNAVLADVLGLDRSKSFCDVMIVPTEEEIEEAAADMEATIAAHDREHGYI